MQITASMVKELRDLTGAGMSACKNALTEAAGDIKRASEILREKGLAAAAKKAGRIAAEGLVAAAVSDNKKSGTLVEVNSETDFVAKNEDFITFVKNMAVHALASDAASNEELLALPWTADTSQTAGEVLTGKIAIIGENIGLRRFAKFDASANSIIVEYIHGGGRVGAMIEISADEINDQVAEAGKNICMQIAAMSPQYLSRTDVPAEVVASETEIITRHAFAENETEKKPRPEHIIKNNIVPGRVAKALDAICLLQQDYVRDDKKTVEEYLKSVGSNVKILRYIRFEKGEGIEKKEENFADEVAKAIQG